MSRKVIPLLAETLRVVPLLVDNPVQSEIDCASTGPAVGSHASQEIWLVFVDSIIFDL